MMRDCQSSIEGGWCRRCVRMRSTCDLSDGECSRHAAHLRVAALEAALQQIVDVYDCRSEMFLSDAECAASMADRARSARATKSQT